MIVSVLNLSVVYNLKFSSRQSILHLRVHE